MKSKKQLTLALALTLALGGSVPVWAEHIQDKTLTKGDWTLKEKLYMEKSYITADQVSLDGSSISEDETYVTTGPVEIKQSTLEGKNGITFSNLKVQAFNGQGYYPDPDHAVGLQGSTLSGKVITIEGASLAQNNGASQLNGLYAEPGDDSVNRKS